MSNYSKTEITGTINLIYAIGLLFAIAALTGWIWNIVKIVGGSFDPLTGIMILRCIGIFIAPLGVVLGFVPA